MAGVYLHIPFCKRICAYCDFYKSADRRLLEPTVESMCREIAARRNYLGGEAVETIYFGGGTPSLCTPQQIGRLMDAVRENFDCSSLGEVTLEANPDDLDETSLSALRRVGINRLSMGVQSMDDDCLQFLNRRHTASAVREAVRAARSAGFSNITLDLIFGIPHFGGASLERSIDELLNLSPEHLSAYHLTIEPQTKLGLMVGRGELQPVDEEVSECEFELVHSRLIDAGYEHYEVSNFAREGFRARHNSSYWHGVKYLGIGPAAHSFDGGERHWNVADTARYIAGAEAEAELLTQRDRFNEYLMTRLRTAEGIELSELERLFGRQRREGVECGMRRWVAAGTVSVSGGRMAVRSDKFLVSDAVIESLFELEGSR